jgi:hypothetical protein
MVKLSTYFASLVAALVMLTATQVYGFLPELSNGEGVRFSFESTWKSLDRKSTTVDFASLDGPWLISTIGDRSTEHSFRRSIKPTAGMTMDEAVAMVRKTVEEHGGDVIKVSKEQLDHGGIADIKGVNHEKTKFIKGRVIVTDSNVFYLETLYLDKAEAHSDFISDFKIISPTEFVSLVKVMFSSQSPANTKL